MGVTETRATRRYKESVERKDEMGAINETEFERLRACSVEQKGKMRRRLSHPFRPFSCDTANCEAVYEGGCHERNDDLREHVSGSV